MGWKARSWGFGPRRRVKPGNDVVVIATALVPDCVSGLRSTKLAGKQVGFVSCRSNVTEHKSNFPEFYITAPQPCPYLPGRLERKLFTHLTRDKPRFLIDNLLKGGVRRSQNLAYMP